MVPWESCLAFQWTLATMYLCAMDVTMSEAGGSAVRERVLAGHRGLQRLSGLEPTSRIAAFV